MKTFRLYLTFALILLTVLPSTARIISDFFFSAPSDVLSLIPTNRRYDMIDYFRYGSETSIKNILDGDSRIISESDNVISLQVSELSTMQLAMLTNEKDTTLAVITTVAVPVTDSSIAFYDKEWNLLKRQPIAAPQYSDWLTKNGKKNTKYIVDILPFILASAEFDPDVTTLTFTNNSAEYLPEEEFQKVSQWLIPSITYDISGIKLKLRK